MEHEFWHSGYYTEEPCCTTSIGSTNLQHVVTCTSGKRAGYSKKMSPTRFIHGLYTLWLMFRSELPPFRGGFGRLACGTTQRRKRIMSTGHFKQRQTFRIAESSYTNFILNSEVQAVSTHTDEARVYTQRRPYSRYIYTFITHPM